MSHTLEDPEAWVMPTVMLGRAQFACGHYGPALAAFDEVRAALGEDVPRGSVFGSSLNQTVASRVWSALALWNQYMYTRMTGEDIETSIFE